MRDHERLEADGACCCLKDSGKQSWSTKDPGQEAFSSLAGTGGVITGWDWSCMGAMVGEQRMLEIPP